MKYCFQGETHSVSGHASFPTNRGTITLSNIKAALAATEHDQWEANPAGAPIKGLCSGNTEAPSVSPTHEGCAGEAGGSLGSSRIPAEQPLVANATQSLTGRLKAARKPEMSCCSSHVNPAH